MLSLFDILIIPIITSCVPMVWKSLLMLVAFATRGHVQLFETCDKMTVSLIRREIKHSVTSCDDKPEGLFFGYSKYFFVGLITKKKEFRGEIITVYILTTKTTFTKLSSAQEIVADKKSLVTVVTRSGAWWNLVYSKRDLDFTSFKARPDQTRIIVEIMKLYKDQSSMAFIFHGPTGTGKSMTARLLAKELGGSFCNTFVPTDPNDMIGQMYVEINPTKEKPLILTIEEGDVMIEKIFANQIVPHKNYSTSITDKAGWNNFLDDLKIMYPWIILIITSNRSPAEIIEISDESAIREGRIDYKYEFLTDHCTALLLDQ